MALRMPKRKTKTLAKEIKAVKRTPKERAAAMLRKMQLRAVGKTLEAPVAMQRLNTAKVAPVIDSSKGVLVLANDNDLAYMFPSK